MESKWHEIWERKGSDSKIGIAKNGEELFLELKRLNGFDVIGDGISYESLISQYESTKKMLITETEKRASCKIESIFEIGCGSGANLFLFEKDGYKTGGIDYSESLIEIAKKVLCSNCLQCDEASNVQIEKQFDVVLSNSVFSYFPDYQYAEFVLERCLAISHYAIGLLDIHDFEKEDAFIAFRKKEIKDYEERYKNLPKFFYKKSFFEDFAKKHCMDIIFTKSEVEGYWNNDFIFNVFMYKR